MKVPDHAEVKDGCGTEVRMVPDHAKVKDGCGTKHDVKRRPHVTDGLRKHPTLHHLDTHECEPRDTRILSASSAKVCTVHTYMYVRKVFTKKIATSFNVHVPLHLK